ncbi:hypothetical protein ACWCXH_10135 [Kitasatospora sp. NPDC001660]
MRPFPPRLAPESPRLSRWPPWPSPRSPPAPPSSPPWGSSLLADAQGAYFGRLALDAGLGWTSPTPVGAGAGRGRAP